MNNRGISLFEVMMMGTLAAVASMGAHRAYMMYFGVNFHVQAKSMAAKDLDLVLNRVHRIIAAKNAYKGEIRPLSGVPWVAPLDVSDNATCPATGDVMSCHNLVVTQRKLTPAGNDYRKVSLSTTCVPDPDGIGTSNLSPLINSMGSNPSQQICSGSQLPQFKIETVFDGKLPANLDNLNVESYPAPGTGVRGLALCFRVCPKLYANHVVAPDLPSAYNPPATVVIQATIVYRTAPDRYDMIQRSKTIVLSNLSPEIVMVPPGEAFPVLAGGEDEDEDPDPDEDDGMD